MVVLLFLSSNPNFLYASGKEAFHFSMTESAESKYVLGRRPCKFAFRNASLIAMRKDWFISVELLLIITGSVRISESTIALARRQLLYQQALSSRKVHTESDVPVLFSIRRNTQIQGGQRRKNEKQMRFSSPIGADKDSCTTLRLGIVIIRTQKSAQNTYRLLRRYVTAILQILFKSTQGLLRLESLH